MNDIFIHENFKNALKHAMELSIAGWVVYHSGLIVHWEQPEKGKEL